MGDKFVGSEVCIILFSVTPSSVFLRLLAVMVQVRVVYLLADSLPNILFLTCTVL